MKKAILLICMLILCLKMHAKNNTEPCSLALIEVTNSNDSGAGSLRQAVIDASNGDEITFNVSTNGNPIVLSGSIQTDKDITFTGNGANNTIIDGGFNDRIFFFLAGSTIYIEGITVRNGRVTQNNAVGGGIISGGDLTMTNCKVIGNSVEYSTQDSATYGGGIVNNGNGTLTLINCLVAGNAALTNGGGIYNSSGDLFLINTTVTGNKSFNYTASGTIISRGGGIYNAVGWFGIFQLTNSIVWGNFSVTEDPNVHGTITNPNYSIVGDINLTGTGTGNFDGTNPSNDPQFIALPPFIPNNIPNTLGDYHLKITSPMVDAGNNAANTEAFDLDNETRIVDGDLNSSSTIDLGCYEFSISPKFITRWKTDNPGSSANNQITLPLSVFLGSDYNYTVEWGDGTSDSSPTGDFGNVTHTYPAPGTYEVSISGDFPRILFNDFGDKDKIVAITNWGAIQWSSMNSAFEGCTNLVIEAIDTPDLSNVTDCREMFRGATSINTGLENWDMSTVTNATSMLENTTSFNGNITGWNVQNIVSMVRMFQGATAFNRPIGVWQTTSLTNSGGMFKDATAFNHNISNWDVQNVTEFMYMFENATAFNQDIGNWDTSSAETMAYMFAGATNFDQDLGGWDISSLSTALPTSNDGANNMFEGVTLSTDNYDSLLIGWNTLDPGETEIPNYIPFNGGNSMYCAGANAKANLITTHNWTITDGGTTPPVAVCQNITAFLDASGNVSILASDLDGGSSADCGIITFSASQTDFNCSDLGANSVILTVSDAAGGNPSQCTAIVTIVDNTPPTLTCPAAISVNNDLGVCEASVTVPQPSYSDNCSEATIALEFDGANDYVTAGLPALFNDIANNDFTIEMWVNPSAFGIPRRLFFAQKNETEFISILLSSSGEVYSFTYYNGVYSSEKVDNIPIPLNNWSHIAVRWSATSHTSSIFINGILQPSISGGGSSVGTNNTMTIGSRTDGTQNFQGQMDEIRIWKEARTNADILNNYQGCVSTSETNLEAYYKLNDGNGSSIATDNSGNGHTGILTNMDINTSWIAGYINCSELILVNDYNNTDNASGVYPVGDTMVTWTATDSSGNSSTCTQTITVNDTENPIANCAAPFTIQLDASGNASIAVADIENGSTDNCGVASTAIDITDFDCSNVGDNTVTLTVTDVNGNVSTCTTIVTVEDNVAPVANCAAPFTIQLDPNGNASITVADIENGSTDTCGIASTTIDISDFTCAEMGDNTVTLTVTDVNGNVSTCTTVVTVEDNVAPVANCAAPFTIQLDANGNASITAANIDNGSTDACGIASTSIDITDFTCADVGPNTVTLTVIDVNGNSSTCTTIVTVEDNVPPMANCAAPFTIQLDASGNASITVADIENGSTDACGIASTTIDISDFTCAEMGDNTVTLTVTDVNGNVSTCTTIVTVEDSISPTIVCPADITANTDVGNCYATVSFANVIALDNCGVDTVVQTSGLPSGSQFPVGTTTIEFTATDVNGNTSTCSFTITVTDNEAPVAVCQNITIQLDAAGNASIVAADVDGGSTDQCGVANISIDIDTFYCSDVGDNPVVLTVTDVNGNVSTCTAIVTVEDVTAPVVACQNITVELDPVTGTVTILGTDIDNGSTDACGIANYGLDIDTFNCSNIGDNAVVLTVTDVNGNSETCTAIVTVEDNTSPTLVCQDFTLELGTDGTATLDPSDVIASNDDACGILTVAVDITQFSCADIGTPVTVQIFSQDNNGNLSTCSAVVTVVDILAPVLTCPADQTVDPGQGNLFYIVPDYFATGEATATDNCTDTVTITTQVPAAGTALADGVHTITLTATDEYGNTDICEFELTVESVLGTGDNNQNLGSIAMYPNPAKNNITIGNPQSLELESADIYDLTGRLVQSFNLMGMATAKTLNVENLAAATYLVIIKGKKGKITKRLLKE